MVKLLTLLCMVMVTLASVGGFVYLTTQINAGQSRIAQGQEQLAAGRAELRSGKARLAEGKEEFRQAKKDAVKDLLLGGESQEKKSDAEKLQNLVQGGRDYRDARNQIAEGERTVAQGESQLTAGEQQLRQGKEQLELAKQARIATGASALLFGILSMVLAFLWRQSLFKKS